MERGLSFMRLAVLAAYAAVTSTLIAQDRINTRHDAVPVRRIPDVVYIPTPHDVVAEMLKLAGLSEQDILYDLGCGDGRIVVLAAQRYGCRAVGIDIDPLRVAEARKNVRAHRLEHLVSIEHGDIFCADLSEATVATVYLSTRYNTTLLPQLTGMKPGSRIVSHQFGIEGIRPDRVVSVRSSDGHDHRLLVWKIEQLVPR